MRRPTTRSVGGKIEPMKAIANTIRSAQPRDGLLLLAASTAALVLASLDQSTRGPSLTALVLTHLQWFC